MYLNNSFPKISDYTLIDDFSSGYVIDAVDNSNAINKCAQNYQDGLSINNVNKYWHATC